MRKMMSKDLMSKFVFSMMLVFTSILGYAQCTPVVVNNNGVEANTGVFCEGEIISFKANSTGYTGTSVLWDFDYIGNTSASVDPTFSYPTAGTYNVTFAGTGPAGSCTGAVTVRVKPSPKIKVGLANKAIQCFKNNNFCFVDSSNVNVTGGVPDGKIAKVTYLFSNALKIETIDPAVVNTSDNGIYNEFCVTITDPTGGSFDLVVQTLDTSGCLSEVTFKDIIYVHPKLGISLINVTPTNPDCDSTLGRFRNTSVIALADLDTFYWNFGDGDSLFGTPNTNTQYWTGNSGSRMPVYPPRIIPNVIQHLYDSNGTYNVMLIGQAFGCKDTATLSSAVTNLVLEPKIISSPNPACVPDATVVFGLTGLNGNQPDRWLWNFGVPPAGNLNFNNTSLAPAFTYGIGPSMASLRIEIGPCDITVYDTIRIVGVSSTIGVAFDQIAQNQTYQCVVRDTVCMKNNSSFYQADFNKLDEDEMSVYFTTSFDRIYDKTTGQYEWRYREWQEGPRGNFVQLDSLYNTGDTITQRGIKAYVDASNDDSITVISGTDTTRYKEPTHRLDKNGNEDYGTLNAYVGGDRPESYRGGTGARYRLEFLYTPPLTSGGVGVGDQTAIPLANPAPRNRDYNPNVWRVWTMGDRFAPQCTTDSRPWVNKNVGINCNWRIDSVPCHWYTPWNEIYRTLQDGRNYSEPQVEVRINKTLKECYQVSIYADSTLIQKKRVILTVPIDSSYTYYIRDTANVIFDSIQVTAGIDQFSIQGWTVDRADGNDLSNFLIDTSYYNERKPGPILAYFEPFNLTIRRTEILLYGTEFKWLAAMDTFISIYNGDTLYHNEDTLGRNNPLAGNGNTQWTVTDYATRITVPAGVTITTLQLDPPAGGGGGGGPIPGTRRTLVGPLTVMINANEQIRIEGGDSIKFELGSETIDADTTYAQPSTVVGTKKVFGVDVRDEKQEIFIDSAVHRQKWFDENAACYTISLWHKDTITPAPFDCESTSTKSLALGPPSAKGMVWEFGDPCPFQGQIPYILGFNMSETKPGCTQPWFAVNYDTFLFDVNLNTSWNAFNGGQVFGTPPQVPIPFVLPYAIAGNWPTTFLKGYAPGVIGNPYLRDPIGSFSLGLIVGNGPAIPATPGVPGSGSPAECLDTAYYPDLFRILPIDASFSIMHPKPIDADGNYHLCPGDTVWYKFNTTLQDSIRSLRWNWGYPGGDNSPDPSLYSEIFSYYKPYGGPRPYRNDSDIVWNTTDKWLYNYVVRNTLEDFEDQPPIGDTIVTSIIKDWKIVAKTGNADILVKRAFERLGVDYNSLPKEDIAYYLGDGTFGCIDTTGISQFFQFGVEIYSDRAGDEGVFRIGDKIYREDTTVSPPDTIETQHILHFRDSSVQGYDTLLLDTNGNKVLDVLSGLWMHVYKFKRAVTDDICDPTKIDTITVLGSGQMSPSAFLTSTNGCQSFGPTPASFNMGFFNDFKLSDEVICKGLQVRIYDSIRYYQRGEEDPVTFPLRQDIPYWNDPVRYSAGIETFKVDWDDSDTIVAFTRSLPLINTYNETGVYTMTIVAEDSVGCTDTTRFDVFITDVIPDFSFGDELVNCASIVDFLDLTEVKDPCKEACPDDPTIKCDEIISWEWDFGDDTRKSILQNPSHAYTSGGTFDVTLTVKTLLGCEETITKTLTIPGPQPFFEFQNAVWNINDTATICVGDSVAIINRSAGDLNVPTFQFIWGDKSNDPPGEIGDTFSHRYFIADTFEIFMIQSDEIPGTGIICDRMFPDSNPDILIQKRIVVIVNPRPEVEITADRVLLCPNEIVTFTGTYDARYTRLKWLLGDNEERNEEDETINTYQYSYSQPGTYSVILAPEYDELPKCPDKDTVEIEVVDVTAGFDIDDSGKPEFCFTNTSTTQPTAGGKLDLFWTIQELEPLPEIKVQTTSDDLGPVCHNYEDREGTFEICLIAINEIGCSDTICKTVENDQVPELKPYNVFTPGSKDPLQLNNTFVVEGQNLETYEIKIFNRWGESVYRSTDITKSWNGQVNNSGVDCPDGTYYYIINYQFLFGVENEGKGPIEGSVQLIREK